MNFLWFLNRSCCVLQQWRSEIPTSWHLHSPLPHKAGKPAPLPVSPYRGLHRPLWIYGHCNLVFLHCLLYILIVKLETEQADGGSTQEAYKPDTLGLLTDKVVCLQARHTRNGQCGLFTKGPHSANSC